MALTLSQLKEGEDYTSSVTQGGQPQYDPLTRFGIGFGSSIGKAGFGLGSVISKGAGYVAGKVGATGAQKYHNEVSKQTLVAGKKIFEEPFQKELDTTAGKVGQFVGTGAVFAAPTNKIVGGQKILGVGGQNILKALNVSEIPYVGRVAKGLVSATAKLTPEIVGTGATEYGISGGDFQSAKTAGLLAGVGVGVFSGLGSMKRTTFWPELKESVTRALGVQGKTTGGRIMGQIEKKVAGLGVIKKYAPETGFNPSTATFEDTLSAWNTTRQNIYNKYNSIAEKAGETVSINLKNIAESLASIVNSPRTSAYKSAAKAILSDLTDNFAQVTDDTVTFVDIPPKVIQTYLSDLYNEAAATIAGRSDKAYGEIAAGVAKQIRDSLDIMIESASGPQYEALRGEYSALKSVEQDLVRRFQQEARQLGGGLTDYANIFSSGDIIAGIISANPALFIKGTGQAVLGGLLKKLKKTDRYLRRSFKLIDQKQSSKLMQRLFGSPMGGTLSDEEMRMVQIAKGYLENPKLGMGIEDVSKKGRGAIPTTNDLTTKILKDLEGKTTVSKQYILDATNRPELKQVERDLIREALKTEGDTINVSDFANKVKAELLPLKRVTQKDVRYETVDLPDDLKMPSVKYEEHIYESPIKTSAGNVHFPGKTTKYYGHTRTRDLADGKTRQVLEDQTDLYQKGNLERELPRETNISSLESTIRTKQEAIDHYKRTGFQLGIDEETKAIKEVQEQIARIKRGEKSLKALQREAEISKLQQYNDPTAHFRMIREEIKKASQDGKTKLQFPTGETAMKIEGLGQANNNNNWTWITKNIADGELYPRLKPENLKVGERVSNGGDQYSQWIITDVLGDGKFKAVPKSYQEAFDGKNISQGVYETHKESFDISGKVDTNNPIYKFYEKDVQRYLSKFGGKRIVDDKGVSWIEIPITKEQGKLPVEAFGIVGLTLTGSEDQQSGNTSQNKDNLNEK